MTSRFQLTSRLILTLAFILFTFTACSPASTDQTGPSGYSTDQNVVGNSYPTDQNEIEKSNPADQNTVENGYPVSPVGETAFENLQPPKVAPVPQPGKAAINGLVYAVNTKLILSNTTVYLTPAEGDNKDQVPSMLFVGGIPSRGDVVGKTNDQGIFEFDNIEPGNYYLVVSFANTLAVVSNSTTDVSPRMLTLKSDSQTALGVVISPGE